MRTNMLIGISLIALGGFIILVQPFYLWFGPPFVPTPVTTAFCQYPGYQGTFTGICPIFLWVIPPGQAIYQAIPLFQVTAIYAPTSYTVNNLPSFLIAIPLIILGFMFYQRRVTVS